MPNWVMNNVRVYGKKEELDAFKDKHFVDGEFDFNTVKKMPKKIFRGNLGHDEREKYGKNNWYDWSVKNWGTKWNAGDTSNVVSHDGYIEFSFNTAWCAPDPIYQKLAKMYKNKLTMVVDYADEDIGNNCGTVDISYGGALFNYIDTVEFACKVWGYDQEEFEAV